MRIISKFHDYYDGVAPFDTDPKQIYVREQNEVDLEVPVAIDLLPRIYRPGHHLYSWGGVLFCGKVYPFWDIHRHICYSPEQVLRACHKQKKLCPYGIEKRIHEKYFSDLILSIKEENPRSGYAGWLSSRVIERLSPKSWKTYKKNFEPEIGDKLFLEANAPVLIVRKVNSCWLWTTNPCLRDYTFASQVDPWAAYQEIEMYLGSNLAKQVDPDTYAISDELKAESKGFDPKWSFRKLPQKKRR